MTPITLPLWQGPVPGALGTEPKDTPTITIYPAKPGSQQGPGPQPAMVILPGGGYTFLAAHEGPAYAEWLSDQGFPSFLVQYRLASDGYRWPAMLWDATRALRWVRAHAAQYGVDPQRIGMIGSSAGGHLLASLATHSDAGNPAASDPVERFSSRPTLGVLCYAPVSVDLLSPASALIDRLLGPGATPEQIAGISPVDCVTADTPPCFMMHTVADAKVNVLQSLAFAQALQKQGVPFEVHIYETGRHGIALSIPGHPWPGECIRWLRERFR